MISKYFDVASVLSLQFNASKSHCIAFGKIFKLSLLVLVLLTLCWISSVKYLNVYLLGVRSLKFDTMPVKRAFCAACNNIFMHGADVDCRYKNRAVCLY